jgi:ATP:corrinoid adenosyltransferase
MAKLKKKGLNGVRGLVHIYTGEGKGKTTAALGLGIRACGGDLKVAFVQFLKGVDTGELKTLQGLGEIFKVYRNSDTVKFIKDMNQQEMQTAQSGVDRLWQIAKNLGNQGQCDLLILDEIMAAISTGLLPLTDVVGWVREKPGALELVMTGRNAPAELVELADYVSEIKAVKHPYSRGVKARKGIEF